MNRLERDSGPRLDVTLLDHLLEGCQVIDRDWRYIYVNAVAAQHGRTTAAQLIGRTMMEAYPGIDETPMFAALEQCMEARISQQLENEFTFADGSRAWFELRFEPIPLGVFILSIDITLRKRTEQQLAQAQRLESVGRLAGSIAHDFNNELCIILNYAEFALDQLRSNDPARDDLEEIRKAGDRAANLTRQLLAFSRRQVLQPRVLNLNGVVSGLESMLRRLVGEDIELSMSLAGDLGNVSVDVGQIEQVVMNLVVNARDAMPKGGALSIESCNVEFDQEFKATHFTIRRGPFVMLSVTDSGSGMDATTQAKMFDPFFTTKAAGQGTGLGLATVFGIVKQSEGAIWVTSYPGRGTAFKMYFPRVFLPVEPESARRDVKHAAGGEVILLVEDDEGVRDVAERILTASNYQVLVAPTPVEALSLGQQPEQSIDLLLTDVVMPGMNGHELFQLLSQRHPDLRVVYMSGYTDDAIAAQGIVDPHNHMVAKPFHSTDLAAMVRRALDDHHG